MQKITKRHCIRVFIGVLTVLMMFPIHVSLAAVSGAWPMWRYDSANTGIQPLAGNITKPEIQELFFLKGAVTSTPVFATVHNDEEPTIFFVDSGRVIALASDGTLRWSGEFVLANSVYTVQDVTGDGELEVLVLGDRQLLLLEAETGALLLIKELPSPIDPVRFVLHDFFDEPGLQALIWMYDEPVLSLYRFIKTDDGVKMAAVNTIDGSPYIIGSYFPGFAVADLQQDGSDELILIRYGGFSVYDIRAYQSREGEVIKPVSSLDYIPEGADNGRFYGHFSLQDVTGDGHLDGVMIADGVSMHVGVIEGLPDREFSKLWDRYYGYSGRSDAEGKSVILRVVNRAVSDVRKDGEQAMVYGVFEYMHGAARGEWTLKILQASMENDERNIEKKGYYLWAVETLGDSPPLFFLSRETAANPGPPTTYEVYSFNEQGLFEHLYNLSCQLLYKDTRMPGHISPAGYTGKRRLYTLDATGDGNLELVIAQNRRHEVLQFDESGSYRRLYSLTTNVNEHVYAHFEDKNGMIHFLTKDEKGRIHCLNVEGERLWSYQCGGAISPNLLIGPVSSPGENSLILGMDGSVSVYDVDSDGRARLKSMFSGSDPILADMTNDGVMEIVVRTTQAGTPVFRVMNARGMEIWSVAVDKDHEGVPLGFGVTRDFSVGDVNGDGVPDIVVGLQDSYPLGRTAVICGKERSILYVTPPTVPIGYVHAGGQIIDRATLAQPGRFALADTNGDGKKEIYFVSLEALMRLKMLDTDAFRLDTYVAQVNGNLCRIYYSTPYLYDLSGDGYTDFFFGAGFNSVSVFSGRISLSAITARTFPLWDLVVENNQDLMYRQQGIAPCVIDGEKRAVVAISFTSGQNEKGTVIGYDGKSGSVLWRYDMKEHFGGTNVRSDHILACDINGDGNTEFIVGTNTGYIVALRSAPELENDSDRVLWSVYIGASVSTMAIGDVDNQGYSSIVAAAHDGVIRRISFVPSDERISKESPEETTQETGVTRQQENTDTTTQETVDPQQTENGQQRDDDTRAIWPYLLFGGFLLMLIGSGYILYRRKHQYK